MRSVVPEDAELDWMYKSFNCSSKTPIKVTVIDTPSLFTGSKYKVKWKYFAKYVMLVIS